MSFYSGPKPQPASGKAIEFLGRYGRWSLVSLGCGTELNRLDNHLRLFVALGLKFYVGIDCAPVIEAPASRLFAEPEEMASLLSRYYRGEPGRFFQALRLFPNTWVEELAGIPCAVVVCQRVLPGCHWEDVIVSMSPLLVLQEDLHGCERQKLRGRGYVRTWLKIREYGLRPFRPWPIFPWERNLVLWRRQDFGEEEIRRRRTRWFWRFCERYIG